MLKTLLSRMFIWRETKMQYLAAMACGIGCAMCSISLVWLSPILSLSNKSQMIFAVGGTRLLLAYQGVAEIFATIPAAAAANRLGRRNTMLYAFPVMAACWLVLSLSSEEDLSITNRMLGDMFVVRVVQGVATGIVYSVAPVYLAEISGPGSRGNLCGFAALGWDVGLFLALWVGPILSYGLNVVACATCAMVFAVSMAAAPESPYYLVAEGMEEAAVRALNALCIPEELPAVKRSVEDSGWSCRPRTTLILTCVIVVRFLCALSTMAFLGRMLGIHFLLALGTGFILVLSSLSSTFISDRWGRRKLYLGSLLFFCLMSFVTFLYTLYGFFLDSSYNTDNIAFILMHLTIICVIRMAIVPVSDVLQVELASYRFRPYSCALSLVMFNIIAFLIVPTIRIGMDTFIPELINFFVSLLIFSILYFNLEETSGKAFDQIHGGSGLGRFNYNPVRRSKQNI